MLVSSVPLSQGKGTINIERTPGSAQLDVSHISRHGELIEQATIERIDGEPRRDMKARAIAAVRLLAYWPELQRELARERLAAGSQPAPELTIADVPPHLRGAVSPETWARLNGTS